MAKVVRDTTNKRRKKGAYVAGSVEPKNSQRGHFVVEQQGTVN